MNPCPTLASLLAFAALAGGLAAQSLVLPDNMNLGLPTNTSTSVWRTVAGRFQAAYDTSHFTNAGATGPVTITRLRFRAEDGQPDLGGHVFANVSVELGTCAVDYAALSSTFATNRGVMGAPGLTSVTLLPASGAVPNDYVIDIDLAAIGASIVYDPTLGSDLLIDVNYGAPAPTTNLVPFSVGSTTAATARGRMCYGTQTATTGSLTAPPTVLIDFAGPGGYAASIPATSQAYGYGCNGTYRSFYQDFFPGDSFDLVNTSLTLTPDNVAAPNFYVVTAGTQAPDVNMVNAAPNSVADDALVTHALGFTFAYPSGSTATIKPSTNGFVWLDSAMTLTDNSPTPPELFGTSATLTARLAPLWFDFHAGRNTVTHANSGLHVMTDTSGGPGNAVCYVTWLNVGIYNQNAVGGTSVNTLQVVLYEATGVVEYRYGAMSLAGIPVRGMVGWSPGRVNGVGSTHPGPRDVSHEVPFATSALDSGGSGLSHDTTVRPITGQPFALRSYNSAATSVFGAFLVSYFVPQQPAIYLPPLANGCGVSLPLGSLMTYDIVLAPVGTMTSTAPITVPVGYEGLPLFTQYATLDAAGVVFTSHARKLICGWN